MSNKQNTGSITIIAGKYGAFVTMAMVALSFFSIRNQQFAIITIVVITGIGIWYAQTEYKNKNEGNMSFSEGLNIAMFLALVVGILQALKLLVTNTIYWKTIKEAHQKNLEILKETLLKQKASDEKIKKSIEVYENYSTYEYLYNIVGALMLGLVLGLIISAIQQRNSTKKL